MTGKSSSNDDIRSKLHNNPANLFLELGRELNDYKLYTIADMKI